MLRHIRAATCRDRWRQMAAGGGACMGRSTIYAHVRSIQSTPPALTELVSVLCSVESCRLGSQAAPAGLLDTTQRWARSRNQLNVAVALQRPGAGVTSTPPLHCSRCRESSSADRVLSLHGKLTARKVQQQARAAGAAATPTVVSSGLACRRRARGSPHSAECA